jgi:hypothetical protein
MTVIPSIDAAERNSFKPDVKGEAIAAGLAAYTVHPAPRSRWSALAPCTRPWSLSTLNHMSWSG